MPAHESPVKSPVKARPPRSKTLHEVGSDDAKPEVESQSEKSKNNVPSPQKIVSKNKRMARDADDATSAKAAKGKMTRMSFDYEDRAAIEKAEQEQAEREKAKWPRPTPPNLNPSTDELLFQQMDIQQSVSYKVLPGMPGYQRPPVNVIRMFGITQQGVSVMCKVHGFTPYMYIQAPANFDPRDCDQLRVALNRLVEQSVNQGFKAPEYVLSVSIVQKKTVFGYTKEGLVPFIKVVCALPKHVPTLRGRLREFQFGRYPAGSFSKLFECDVPFELRFMIDRGVVGAGWIRLPAGCWSITPKSDCISEMQIEVDVAYDKFEALPSDQGIGSTIAPLRILSFDIECAGRPNVFPEAEHDPVIQIASVVTRHGEPTPFIQNVFVLDTCSSIVGAHVVSFKTEQELLMAWRNFVAEVDPDVLIGYNIANFDLPYLVNRAAKLKLTDFALLGRLRGVSSRIKNTKFTSSAYGTRESQETTMEGRIPFDILQVIQREHKLRSYSLNTVADEFLGEQKEDVHYSIIGDLQRGTAEDRRRLAVYCLKDARLPMRLMEKLMISYNYIEMARVTGVPISFLLARGQQVKVVSQLYRKAAEEDYLIPYYKREVSAMDDEGYEGATVIEPARGFYEDPIATLDFASLYPSIMMAHNLCYSTLVGRHEAKQMDPAMLEKTPAGDYFVKSSVRKGLLPRILEELLSARKKAKQDLKRETDPFKRAVLDGRQLALKISANSVYGFTGATVGKLPCIEISAGTTSYGRQMIETTKRLVEQKYTMANGYEHDAVVIYGDTDSVMVKFGTSNLAEAMKLGKEAADEVTKEFISPIKLEFEKVYYPYLLINKKRYAGLYWTRPDKWDKMDTKGIETVRRDNCYMVKNLITECLRQILIERNIEGAKHAVKTTISDLLQNKMDLSLLVITKALSKEGKDYAVKQAHTELADRMRKRDPATAPAIGDRVPYVIIQSSKGAKAYEKAEDPLYVLANDIPLDYEYYIENQLRKPLTRIFEPIMGDCSSLLSGEHTKKIAVPTPKRGGIVGFAVVRQQCLGCKSPLSATERTVCKNCDEGVVYQQQLANVRDLESQYSRVWVQCQACQGSFHMSVLCTSRDCPIFYMRKKVQKSLQSAIETLNKFDLGW